MNFAAEFLASLGGATIILYAFSTFLGKVWADRIAKQTVHGFELELESVRAANHVAFEQSKLINQQLLEDRQSFNSISQKTYQEFFEMRLGAYKRLLAELHKYATETGEDFLVDEIERWGDSYVHHYNTIKGIVGECRLYLSVKLEEAFDAMQSSHNSKLKENERELASLYDNSYQSERESQLNNELQSAAWEYYQHFIKQLKEDVKSLRSRIDLDKV